MVISNAQRCVRIAKQAGQAANASKHVVNGVTPGQQTNSIVSASLRACVAAWEGGGDWVRWAASGVIGRAGPIGLSPIHQHVLFSSDVHHRPIARISQRRLLVNSSMLKGATYRYSGWAAGNTATHPDIPRRGFSLSSQQSAAPKLGRVKAIVFQFLTDTGPRARRKDNCSRHIPHRPTSVTSATSS